MPIEPTGESDVIGKALCLSSNIRKNRLDHVFRKMGIAIDEPKRDGIDKIDVIPHKLPKRFFGRLLDILSKKLLFVTHGGALHLLRSRQTENPTKTFHFRKWALEP